MAHYTSIVKRVKQQSRSASSGVAEAKHQSSAVENVPEVVEEEKALSLLTSHTVTPPTHTSHQEPLRNVVALYSFTGCSDQELSFKEGDILKVTEKESPDWWYGMESDGQQGLIPVNYVQIQESSSPSNDNVRATEDELVCQQEAQVATSLHQQQQSGEEIVQTPLSEPKFPLKSKWRRGRDMPFEMFGGPSVVVMNGDVYLGGGMVWSDKDCQTVCIYSPHSNSWSRLPPYEYRYFRLAVINENQLVAVGGEVEITRKVTNKLAVWDDKQCQWVFSLPAMNTACHSPAVATYNQWLLVAGGCGEPQDYFLSRVQVMNVSSKQWYQVGSLPVAWAQMSSTMIANTWYLIGGFTNEGSINCKSVMSVCVEHIISEAISQQAGANSFTLTRWNSLPDSPFERSTALAFQGALLAIGGGSGSSPSSEIYLYQTSTSKWIKVGDIPTGRTMPISIVLPNGHIMIAGGYGRAMDQVDIAQVL